MICHQKRFVWLWKHFISWKILKLNTRYFLYKGTKTTRNIISDWSQCTNYDVAYPTVMSTTILELRLELGYSYKYASAARDRVCNWIFSHFRRLWCMYPSPSKWATISCGFSLSKHKLIASPSHPKIQTRRVLKANQLQLLDGWICPRDRP